MSLAETLRSITAAAASGETDMKEDSEEFTILMKNLETKYAPAIKQELYRRARAGQDHAYMNFAREDFSNTGYAPPKSVLERFLGELTSETSGLVEETNCGMLEGVTQEVVSVAKLAVKFSW